MLVFFPVILDHVSHLSYVLALIFESNLQVGVELNEINHIVSLIHDLMKSTKIEPAQHPVNLIHCWKREISPTQKELAQCAAD